MPSKTTPAKATKRAGASGTVTPISAAKTARTNGNGGKSETTGAAPAKPAKAVKPTKKTLRANDVPKPKPTATTVNADEFAAVLLTALPHVDDESAPEPLRYIRLAVTPQGYLLAMATDSHTAIRIVPESAIVQAGKAFDVMIAHNDVMPLCRRLRSMKVNSTVELSCDVTGQALHIVFPKGEPSVLVGKKVASDYVKTLTTAFDNAPTTSNLTTAIGFNPAYLARFAPAVDMWAGGPVFAARFYFGDGTGAARVEVVEPDGAEIIGIVLPFKTSRIDPEAKPAAVKK